MIKRVLSLGGGDIELPDLAVFADTGWEPAAVYENVEWLMSEITAYPIVVTRAYR